MIKKFRKNQPEETPLNLPTRNDIYEYIQKNQGIHFRALCRGLDRRMGVVQYHVKILEQSKLIYSISDARYKCFFASNIIQSKLKQQMQISMKKKTIKIILEQCNENVKISHTELSKKCSVSGQAITYHCKNLEKKELIRSETQGREKFYTLNQELRGFI